MTPASDAFEASFFDSEAKAKARDSSGQYTDFETKVAAKTLAILVTITQ